MLPCRESWPLPFSQSSVALHSQRAAVRHIGTHSHAGTDAGNGILRMAQVPGRSATLLHYWKPWAEELLVVWDHLPASSSWYSSLSSGCRTPSGMKPFGRCSILAPPAILKCATVCVDRKHQANHAVVQGRRLLSHPSP